MDVQHAETERRLVRQVAELLDHLVAGTRLVGGPQLAAVIVREADRELLAVLHALDRRKEEVVSEKHRWVENIAFSPSTLALKLSTNRSSSSASVDAPGSSTWIQRAPSVIKASRFGRIKFRATSRTNSRRAALRSRMRSAAGCSRFSGARLRSSNDQSAIVYAPVTGILSSASATDTRYENSALWKGEPREIAPTTAALL